MCTLGPGKKGSYGVCTVDLGSVSEGYEVSREEIVRCLERVLCEPAPLHIAALKAIMPLPPSREHRTMSAEQNRQTVVYHDDRTFVILDTG